MTFRSRDGSTGERRARAVFIHSLETPMKKPNLSFLLAGLLLASAGIVRCGGDDEGIDVPEDGGSAGTSNDAGKGKDSGADGADGDATGGKGGSTGTGGATGSGGTGGTIGTGGAGGAGGATGGAAGTGAGGT